MSSSYNENLYIQSDFMTRKAPVYSEAIHALGDNAKLRSTNMFGKPIKCFTCGCSFHINKHCGKYNNLKLQRL